MIRTCYVFRFFTLSVLTLIQACAMFTDVYKDFLIRTIFHGRVVAPDPLLISQHFRNVESFEDFQKLHSGILTSVDIRSFDFVKGSDVILLCAEPAPIKYGIELNISNIQWVDECIEISIKRTPPPWSKLEPGMTFQFADISIARITGLQETTRFKFNLN